MYKRSIKALLHIAAYLTFTNMAGSGTASAENSPAPIAVEVSVSADAITPGEPIILNFRVTNHSVIDSTLYLGRETAAWLTIRFVDATGKDVTAFVKPRPHDSSGFTSSHNLKRLNAMSVYSEEIVVTQRFRPNYPGNYRLLVKAHLPYAQGTNVEAYALARQAGTFFEKEWTLPILITPTDGNRLRTVAESLRRSVLQSDGAHKPVTALAAVFSMPEAYALPTWQALVRDPKISPSITSGVAALLARVNSRQAADLLAEIVFKPKQQTQQQASTMAGGQLSLLLRARRSKVRSELLDMHYYGDASLKRHIESLFTWYGEKMPKLSGPIVNG